MTVAARRRNTMELSPHEYRTLQGIERGLAAADPRLAARFAAFSGGRRAGAPHSRGTFLLPVGRGRVPISRRWAVATVLVLIVVEALLITGVTIGNLALVVAGTAFGVLTAVAAGFAVAACIGTQRGANTWSPRPSTSPSS